MKHNSWCQTQALGVRKGKVCSVHTTAAQGGNNDSRREENVKCSTNGITKGFTLLPWYIVQTINIIDLFLILTVIGVKYIPYSSIDYYV